MGAAEAAASPGGPPALARPPDGAGEERSRAGPAAADLQRSSEDKALLVNKRGAPEVKESQQEVEFCSSTSKQLGWGSFERNKRTLFVGMEERWETQWQQFLKTLQPVHPGGDKSKMSEASPWEDPKVFLASFEQVAQACQWPREEWVACLLPALSGEAEEAFQKLEMGERENYGKVKAAILKGEATKMEAQRQRFRQFCCHEVEDPRMVYKQIQELCHQWLKPERCTKEQILELLILEQFLASLPPKLQSWVQPRRPDTCSQAVALVEDFLRSQQGTRSEACQGPPNEEPANFECAEKEPLVAVKGENVEVEIGMLGPGIESPDAPSSLLPSKRLGMVLTALREEVADLKERDVCLVAAKWNLVQPVPQRMVWETLQSEQRNVGSLSGVFQESHLDRILLKGKLDFPPPGDLPGTKLKCHISPFVLQPFLSAREPQEAIPKIRVSRGGLTCITTVTREPSRTIESSFGILATRWRILGRPKDFHPNKVTDTVKACVTLHNYLINTDATNSKKRTTKLCKTLFQYLLGCRRENGGSSWS